MAVPAALGPAASTAGRGWAVLSCVIGVLMVLVLTEGSLGAADPQAPSTEPLERGADLFRIYCVDCHGSAGRGNGPSADKLRVRPADLTSLARSNRGTFPRERARKAIDGRSQLDDHPRTEMPIWGFALQELDRDTEQEVAVRRRIDDLLAYVESIQTD